MATRFPGICILGMCIRGNILLLKRSDPFQSLHFGPNDNVNLWLVAEPKTNQTTSISCLRGTISNAERSQNKTEVTLKCGLGWCSFKIWGSVIVLEYAYSRNIVLVSRSSPLNTEIGSDDQRHHKMERTSCNTIRRFVLNTNPSSVFLIKHTCLVESISSRLLKSFGITVYP